MPLNSKSKTWLALIISLGVLAAGYEILQSRKVSEETTSEPRKESAPAVQETAPVREETVAARSSESEPEPEAPEASEKISEKAHSLPPPGAAVMNRVKKAAKKKKNLASEVPETKKPEAPAAAVETAPPAEPVKPADSPAPVEESKPAGFWLWAGTGVSYQNYQQSVPGLADNSYQNIKSPLLWFRAGAQGASHGFELGYKDMPSEIKSSGSVAVIDGESRWRILSAEYLYREKQSPWNWRLGVQQSSMPFMEPDATGTTVTVRSNSLTMLTAGVERSCQISEKLDIAANVKYQHPVASGAGLGASFKVSPGFSFEASVGAVYKLGANARLGAAWSVQRQDYRFNYQNGAAALNGNQVLLYSNLEVGFGWEF